MSNREGRPMRSEDAEMATRASMSHPTFTGNRALQLCRAPISQLFYPAFLKVFSRLNAGERLVFAHEKILQALRDHNATEAHGWMDKHIVDFRRGYELANLDIDEPVGLPRK